MDGREFVWAHFKLNAEQRLRGFNFFVVLAIFADGGVLAALQRGFSLEELSPPSGDGEDALRARMVHKLGGRA